jgi:hypothetical protein
MGMTNNSSFHDLKVWRQAMTLAEEIYRLSVANRVAEVAAC